MSEKQESTKKHVKKLAGQTLIYGLGNILNRAITFLLLPLYTNILSQENFGSYTLIYTFLGLMNVLYLYGTDAAFMRFFIPESDDAKRKTIFSTLYSGVLFSTLGISALLLLITPSIAGFFDDSGNQNTYLYLATLILTLDGLSFIPVLTFRALQKPMRYSAIIFAEVLINLGLNILFVAVLNYGLEGALWANVISSLTKLILSSFALWGRFEFKIKSTLWREMMSFGLPTMPAVFFAMVTGLADRFILKGFFNKETVALYGAGYKIGIVMALVVTAFRFAWQPFFLSISKQDNAKQTYAKVLTLFVSVAGFVFLIVSHIIAPFITQPIFGKTLIPPSYEPGMIVIPIVMLGFLIQGIYVNLVVGMYIQKKTHLSALFTGAGMLVNLTANYLFFAVFHAPFYMAAWSFVMAQGAQTLFLYIKSKQFYPVPYEIGKLTLLAVSLAGLYLFPGLVSWGQIGFWIPVIAYFPILVLIGIITLSQVKEIVYKMKRKTA
jgi:O-antigen/teichoic acid export membrane protein